MIYRFRNLSLKDQMRLEVDFGGEPIPEITEEGIDKIVYGHNLQDVDAETDSEYYREGIRYGIDEVIKQLLP